MPVRLVAHGWAMVACGSHGELHADVATLHSARPPDHTAKGAWCLRRISDRERRRCHLVARDARWRLDPSPSLRTRAASRERVAGSSRNRHGRCKWQNTAACGSPLLEPFGNALHASATLRGAAPPITRTGCALAHCLTLSRQTPSSARLGPLDVRISKEGGSVPPDR